MAGAQPTGEPAEDPDLELVRRVGDGDARACAALVDRLLPKVLGLAGRMLGNRADAEEVAQETFLRAWQQAGRWRPGEARFSTWLHRVTLNLCHDRLRRRRETALDAAGDPPSLEAAPGTDLQRAAVTARIEAALARLPDRQRSAILLCHYQELGNIEAAEVLGISVEALESLLARGRRRLKDQLAGEAADLMGELQ
ncbi:RNA polymerase sigma factor [Rhodospirillaceae bacterium SYSU D60014]|uniref:RNA polymerase sigma factor n=1 Tax=Virgifigura deserti TaxID=2268457 RepID=UPI000E664E10